ncbi:protein-glutamine gamma-glutamyltransferase 5-like [Bombina bombina]|uniref:protein-glutamine gamma-glutamyltransferase 5-like n=1 Tax=Bombina bombina TaxID=8345 RepID=UPI00235ACFE6|nr:protein-glutamine gamma-glutamyltransferase 5-like [Bombina bombina]
MAFQPELSNADFEKHKNGLEHKTDLIRSRDLTIRRGQPFTVKLLFRCRDTEEKLENLNIIAQTGPHPKEQLRTQIKFPVYKLRDSRSWSAELISGNVTSLAISLCTAATASIGRYVLCLEGTYRGRALSFTLGNILLLFNPWCPDDDVFLDDEVQRQEYVMNEHGILYQGSKDFIQSQPWNFGQFEDGVGDICLKILDMSPNFLKNPSDDCARRGDPVYVSRIISTMINSNDDLGVLESCWDQFFRNGANPNTWNGSVTILRLWHRSNCRPVRYGQCWVLAGVMCTVMRFLGIPTRVVTNFESAHDTNCSLTVDEYYDETGRKIESAETDSVWNFHVWNECWMARKDLRPGYDGWQVLDATPQELSGGTFCCGPAPVKAVKEGDIDVDYDVPFVFAEVNGDIIHWIIQEHGMEKGNIDTLSIGKYISTKSVGSNSREDITDQYKYTEGSYQERAVYEKAVRKMKIQKPQTAKESVVALDFDVSLKLAESPLIGQTIFMLYQINNKSYESKRYSVNVSAQAMQYNGKPLDQFWTDDFIMDVNANRAADANFQIFSYQYQRYVRSGNNIRVTVLATDLVTKKLKFASKNIIFDMPGIEIQIYGSPELNKPLSVTLSFTNPFNDILSNCMMTAEGAGLLPSGPITVYMDQIFPYRSGYVKICCVPVKHGTQQLEVNFSCDKIKFVKGSALIAVPF